MADKTIMAKTVVAKAPTDRPSAERKTSVPETIGKYKSCTKIASGGMGAVFEVEHLRLGTHYALKTFTFEADEMPTEIRLEHHGYGRAQLAFVAVEDAKTRIVPTKVLSVTGDVEHAERLLADDYEWADFGTCGFLEKFFDAEKEAKVSSVTLEMSNAAR